MFCVLITMLDHIRHFFFRVKWHTSPKIWDILSCVTGISGFTGPGFAGYWAAGAWDDSLMSVPALVAVAPIGGFLRVQESKSDFPEPGSSIKRKLSYIFRNKITAHRDLKSKKIRANRASSKANKLFLMAWGNKSNINQIKTCQERKKRQLGLWSNHLQMICCSTSVQC